jgi:hypothetical protein
MQRPKLPGTIELEPAGHYLEPLHVGGDKSAEISGYVEHHPDARPERQGRDCSGYLPLRQDSGGRPSWVIEQGTPAAPQTLRPSIQCTTCGAHFFIRDGRAVPA